MLNQDIHIKVLVGVGLFLSLIIFFVDLVTPLGIADGISYIAIVLLTIWIKEKRFTIIAMSIGVLFIIAGYFFSPVGEKEYIALTNRTLSIAAIVACSVVMIKYKKSSGIVMRQKDELSRITENLRTVNQELEERVKERTSLLEDALRNLEFSKQELQKKLEHEQELNELKSRFVSMASHEFRTPLATILSSLSLVSKYGEPDLNDKQLKHIYRIKGAVTHLTDLINDVLSVSKLEEGKIPISLEKLQVSKITGDVAREMELIAKKNQKIEYEHIGVPEIVFDRKVLRHILMNLISNAIKFSSENSIIKVNTQVDNSDFIIGVKDKGIGISPEDQNHLFERFFRGNNVSTIQGTGLGLNIVAKYVEIMNGDINVTSELGEGTLFTIKFDLEKC